MFKPGESGNPAELPVGAKDKKWATLQFWFERIIESLKDESLKPAERLNAELRIAELILARKKLLRLKIPTNQNATRTKHSKT